MDTADRNDVQDKAKTYKIALGTMIRELREQKDWSQEKLAEVMGVAANTVSRMENGKYNMDTFLFAVIALGGNPTKVFSAEIKYEELNGLDTLEKSDRDFVLIQTKASISHFKTKSKREEKVS